MEAIHLIEVLNDHPTYKIMAYVWVGLLAASSVCVLEDLCDWNRGEGLNIKENLHLIGYNMSTERAAVSKRPVRNVEYNIPRAKE